MTHPDQKSISGYVNFYKGGQVGALWPDRKTADKHISGERVACRKIVVNEGEFDG